jgi:hypothetical protein
MIKLCLVLSTTTSEILSPNQCWVGGLLDEWMNECQMVEHYCY